MVHQRTDCLPVGQSVSVQVYSGIAPTAVRNTFAQTECLMGVAGPLMSALIGGLCLGLAWMLGWPVWTEPATPLLAMLVWLG